MLERLKPLMARQLGRKPEEIAQETYMEDLGASSLDLVEITLEAESEFGVLLAGKPLFDAAILVFGPGVLEEDGELTDAGRRLIARRFQHLTAAEVAAMTDVADVQRQVSRVSVWAETIAALTSEIPDRCRAHGGRVRVDSQGIPACTGADDGYAPPSLEEWNQAWIQRLSDEELPL